MYVVTQDEDEEQEVEDDVEVEEQPEPLPSTSQCNVYLEKVPHKEGVTTEC